MLELDPRTTIFVNAVYSFFTVSFLFFFARFSSEKKKALWSWTIAFSLISANFFILPLRGILPTLFIVLVPHIGVFIAYSLIKKGVCSFWEIPNKIYRDGILLVIFISLLLYFRDNTQARVLTVTLLPSLLILDTIFHIFTHRKTLVNTKIVSTILSISFAIQMVRFYLGLYWPKVKDPLVLGNNLSAISILFFLSMMSTFFCLIYIYFQNLLQERNNLVSELKIASQTDELTQLRNRRAFHEILSYEIKKTQRFKSSFAVAIADIDFFKQINDTYGHQCGDNVLRLISKELQSNIREIDTLARWGGEEFVFLLPGINRTGAEGLFKRIRLAIEAMSFEHEGEEFKKTMSFGLAFSEDFDKENLTAQSLISDADTKLYTAKESGRNTVIM